MKNFFSKIIPCILILVMLTACGNKAGNNIVGKWYGSTHAYAFYNNGSYDKFSNSTQYTSGHGTWSIVDKNHLRIDDYAVGPTVFEFELKGDTLILDDEIFTKSGTEMTSQQNAADKFANGVNTNNMTLILEAMLPDKAIKKLENESGMNPNSYMDPGKFDGISNYKIKVKQERDLDSYELSAIKESISRLGIKTSKVERREMEISYEKDGKREFVTEEAIFYKVGEKWYIIY